MSDRKKKAAAALLVKLVRGEELKSPDLRATLERLERAMEQQPRLTAEHWNMRATI